MQIGLVSQEPTLFATTIYENIAMGKPGATEAEVGADRRGMEGGKGRRGPHSRQPRSVTQAVWVCAALPKRSQGPSIPSPPQVRAAAEAANAQRFIAHLPLQYECVCNCGGEQLV